jgi:hypothetical protein
VLRADFLAQVSIETAGRCPDIPLCVRLYLERIMFKHLLKDAFKSPWKLLGVCLVIYMASMSMFVSGILVLAGIRHLRREHRGKMKAMRETEIREHGESDAQAKADAPVAHQANTIKRQAAANDAIQQSASKQTQKQYAKSAVVVPFKTGSR